ncbi:MAG: hypothetical protein OEV31_05220, partial [Gammaproteobacteria bacterium]|nr:hypothetical protein [Gammaproteobacteria bacterium]
MPRSLTIREKRMRMGMVLAVLLALTGCASIEKDNRMNLFGIVSRAYERALDWSDYESAYAVTKEVEGAPKVDLEALKAFKITSYKAAVVRVSEDGSNVTRRANISYVWLSRMSERSLSVQEE